MVSAASCVIHNVSSSNPPTQHHERHVRLCLSNKPKLARSKKRRNVITAVGHFTSWITEIGGDHPHSMSTCMFVSCLDPSLVTVKLKYPPAHGRRHMSMFPQASSPSSTSSSSPSTADTPSASPSSSSSRASTTSSFPLSRDRIQYAYNK